MIENTEQTVTDTRTQKIPDVVGETEKFNKTNVYHTKFIKIKLDV